MDAVKQITIKTPRLTLKPLSRDVLHDMCRLINNINVSRWLRPVPHPYSLEDGIAFINNYSPSEDGFIWSVHDSSGFVGVIGNESEIGYWIAEPAWGRGYGREMLEAVVAHHFVNPVAPTLTSGHFEGNAPSSGLLCAMGFTYTGGVGRAECMATGLIHPSHRMELTRARWEERKSWLVETRELVIRPFQQCDGANLRRIVTHQDVGKNLKSFPPDWTIQQAEKLISDCAYSGARPFRLAIEEKGSDQLIGSIGVFIGETPDVYYFLDPAVSGRGLGQAAMRAFLNWLFPTFGLQDVTADVFHDNPVSSHVLTKLGFVHTGQGMGTSAARLEPEPVSLYRLSKQRFESMPT